VGQAYRAHRETSAICRARSIATIRASRSLLDLKAAQSSNIPSGNTGKQRLTRKSAEVYWKIKMIFCCRGAWLGAFGLLIMNPPL
jgi:hypothetical protein